MIRIRDADERNNVILFEPLGEGLYFVCNASTRAKGVVTARDEGKGKGPWTLELDNLKFQLSKAPLDSLPWHVPSVSSVKLYCARGRKVMSNQEIFQAAVSYFQKFGDYEDPWAPYTLTLFEFQTQIRVLLATLFQQPIGGPFGSGKTAALEAMVPLSYHGFLAGSASPASVAYLTEECQCTWFVDELDKFTGDEESRQLLTFIFRQGYRRGSKYTRYDKDLKTTISIEIFLPLAYTLSTEVEKALKTRAFGEASLKPTADFRVAVINQTKQRFGQAIGEEMFFWRAKFLEDYFNQLGDSPDALAAVSDILKAETDEFRTRMYDEATARLSPREKEILGQLHARPSELMYIALQVSSYLKVDTLGYLVSSINQKLLEDSEISDPMTAYLVDRMRASLRLKDGGIPPKFIPLDGEPPKFADISIHAVSEDMQAWAKQNGYRIGGRTWAGWWKLLDVKLGKNKFHLETGEIIRPDKDFIKALEEVDRPTEVKLSVPPVTRSGDSDVPGSKGLADGNEGKDGTGGMS